jgi:hypothetical protein
MFPTLLEIRKCHSMPDGSQKVNSCNPWVAHNWAFYNSRRASMWTYNMGIDSVISTSTPSYAVNGLNRWQWALEFSEPSTVFHAASLRYRSTPVHCIRTSQINLTLLTRLNVFIKHRLLIAQYTSSNDGDWSWQWRWRRWWWMSSGHRHQTARLPVYRKLTTLLQLLYAVTPFKTSW